MKEEEEINEAHERAEKIGKYIKYSIDLMTDVKTEIDVEVRKSVNKNTKQETIIYAFRPYLEEDQVEFLTREEGSALSALAHVVSVMCSKYGISGVLECQKIK